MTAQIPWEYKPRVQGNLIGALVARPPRKQRDVARLFFVACDAAFIDMLNKFIVVRATVKPQEKSQDEASKS